VSAHFLLCRDEATFEAEVSAARARHTLQVGFAPPDPARRGVTCVGPLSGEDYERAALVAAAYGARLIALVDPTRISPGFLEDLSRLGRVEWREREQTPCSVLGAEERSLLEHLAAGLSLAEAARRLHLSRRTADRRLQVARQALGAASTAEALVRLRRNPSARVG
jgi:DNA-binding NarL/FixJ family response regulator